MFRCSWAEFIFVCFWPAIVFLITTCGHVRATSVDFQRGSIKLLNAYTNPPRAPVAAILDHQLDTLKFSLCSSNQALNPSSVVCSKTLCLKDSANVNYIDLTFAPLRLVTSELAARVCGVAVGGQRPLNGGQPKVSFIVIDEGSDVNFITQSLLEIVRIASEVETAEYIVACSLDGCNEQAESFVRQLEAVFNIDIKLIVSNKVERAGIIQSGIEAAKGEYSALIKAGYYVARGWIFASMLSLEKMLNVALIGCSILDAYSERMIVGFNIKNGTVQSNDLRWPPGDEDVHLRPSELVLLDCAIGKTTLLKAALEDFPLHRPYNVDAYMASRLRQAGHGVFIQPLAVVIVDPSLTIRTLDTENILHGDLTLNSCSAKTPSVLWFEDSIFMPDRDSGSVRMMGLLRGLVEKGFKVTLQPMAFDAGHHYATLARSIGVQVLPLLNTSELHQHFDFTFCTYDVFVISRRGNYNTMQEYLTKVCSHVPQVFDTVDIHFMREARSFARRKGLPIFHWRDIVKWLDEEVTKLANSNIAQAQDVLTRRDRELELITKANSTWIVSSEELEVIQHYLPSEIHKVSIVSNVFDDKDVQTSCEDRQGLLFIGNFEHLPNQEAAEYMITRIMPALRNKLPKSMQKFHLHLVGSGDMPGWLDQLIMKYHDVVTFHGYQPDNALESIFYPSVRAAVAPLLTGAGVKGKVNQAMRLGVPIVVTPIAIEGMEAIDGVDCLVGATAVSFAEKIIELFEDCELWSKLVMGGTENVRKNFSLRDALQNMLQTFAELGVHLSECDAAI